MFIQGAFPPKYIKASQARRRTQRSQSKNELCVYVARLNEIRMSLQEKGWRIQKKRNQAYLFVHSLFILNQRLGFSHQVKSRGEFSWSIAGLFSQNGSEGINVQGLPLFPGVRVREQYFESVEFLITTQTASIYGETELVSL